MNKIIFYILIVIAIALIGYNATQVDFENPFDGQSGVALICIVTALCAIVLLAILILSKKIDKKIKE